MWRVAESKKLSASCGEKLHDVGIAIQCRGVVGGQVAGKGQALLLSTTEGQSQAPTFGSARGGNLPAAGGLFAKLLSSGKWLGKLDSMWRGGSGR